jgi:tetratricopeptide (TPR) repeat protein
MRIICRFTAWPWILLPILVGIFIALACGLTLWSNESPWQLAKLWRKGGTADVTYYQKMASIHYEQKDFGLALEAITEAIALEADNPQSYLLRGKIYRGQKNYEAALADFDKLLSLALPRNCMVFQGHLQRGLTQLESNNYPQGIGSLSTAVDIHYGDCYFQFYDDYIEAYYHRAQAREKTGFKSGAAEDYQKYLSQQGAVSSKERLDPEERLEIEERIKQLLEPS